MTEDHSDLNDSGTRQNTNRRGRRLFVLLILFVIIFACFAIIQVMSAIDQGRNFIPGDPYNFDTVAEYEAIEAYAGEGVYLTQIIAHFVRRDGTLELNASYEPAPDVDYHFYRLTGNNRNANTPVGVNASGAVEYQVVRVNVSNPFNLPFLHTDEGDMSFQLDPGMRRFVRSEEFGVPNEHIPPPMCSFRDFWMIAIEEEEANTDAVATIRYDEDGYNFHIRGTQLNLDFDFDCQLVE